MSTVENKVKNMTRKTRRTDSENFYITSDKIYSEWQIWKQTGKATEQLGVYMLEIARGVANKPSFRGYSAEFKNEMVQHACLRMMQNLKNLREEYRDSFFNYLTRTTYCAFYQILNKYHKYVNNRRTMLYEALQEAFTLNPTAERAAIIRDLERQIETYENKEDDVQD